MKHVYRYNDINRPGDGHAEVVLLRRVIIKETEHYVWSVPEPLPWNGVPGELSDPAYYWSHPKRSYNYPKKTKKNAARSAWHVTKEQAMESWHIRKQHQLSRLKLALERVELCVKGVKEQGMLSPGSHIMGEYFPLRVRKTPDCVECGTGSVLSKYNWMEV